MAFDMNNNNVNNLLHNQKIATNDFLLQNARPYRTKKNKRQHHQHHHEQRRLDQNNNEVPSYKSSIKFSQCVDIKLLDKDLFDEDVIEYTKAGQIISSKSFVLFHICDSDDGSCYYDSDDDLYIVDLSVYVQNVATYLATVQSNYCEACDEYYYGLCVAQNDDDDATNNYNYYYGDDDYGGGRQLFEGLNVDKEGDQESHRRRRRRAMNYITCDECEANGCVNYNNDDGQQNKNNNNGGNNDNNGVVELIEDISHCLNTGLHWNDNDLYIGFICSPYGGYGVELAVFLDNECTVYTNLKSFTDIPSYYIYNDEDVFNEAETYIKAVFDDDTIMPCLYEEYDDPANAGDGGDDDAAAAANNNGYQVSEYCTNIFEDEGALALSSCAVQQNDDDQNQNNANANYNNYNNNQNDDDEYNFYEYDMNYDSARDLNQVCYAIQAMEGEYYYQYDEDISGTWNDDYSGYSSRNRKKSKRGGGQGKNSGTWNFLTDSNGGFAKSGLAITLYVMLGVSAIVLMLFVIGYMERKKRERERMDPYYTGGRLV